MAEFKWRHFEGAIILWAVRWYCRYGISYRDLGQMMGERGVPVDHSTIYRWVQKYAPEIEKRLRGLSTSMETRLISISRRHGTRKPRNASSARRSKG